MAQVYLVQIQSPIDSHGGYDYISSIHESKEGAVNAILNKLHFRTMEVEGKWYYVKAAPEVKVEKSYRLWDYPRAFIKTMELEP